MCVGLPIAAKKMYEGGQDFSLNGCHALASLAHLPAFGRKLTLLSLSHARPQEPAIVLVDIRESGRGADVPRGFTECTLAQAQGLQPRSRLKMITASDCEALRALTVFPEPACRADQPQWLRSPQGRELSDESGIGRVVDPEA
jgi:hypothetical protein